MSFYCALCCINEVPRERGIKLCHECTRSLLKTLDNPHYGAAKVIDPKDYGSACRLCGEYDNRRIVVHPEWGKICDVDVKEAAELYGMD